MTTKTNRTARKYKCRDCGRSTIGLDKGVIALRLRNALRAAAEMPDAQAREYLTSAIELETYTLDGTCGFCANACIRMTYAIVAKVEGGGT